ncbi:MAG: extracellular solute-binding protein [Propionibacteriaceae bacterium]|nr:extracellular solute-binding protein [Propionibacteriaceae bacterium]
MVGARKRIGVTLAAAAGLLAMSACGGGTGAGDAPPVDQDLVLGDETVATAAMRQQCEQEGSQLHIYTPAPPEQYQLFTDRFREETGISVTATRLTTSEVYTRAEAEAAGGRLEADILSIGDPTLRDGLVDKGIIEPFETPLSDTLETASADRSEYSAPTRVSSQVIVWNTERVADADAPKSYADLLDPKWKGQFGMTAIQTGLSSITVARSIEEGLGADRVEAFAQQQPKIYVSVVPLTQAVIRGEVPVAITDLGLAEEYIADGNPIKWSGIAEGTPTFAFSESISATSQRKGCALVYIGYLSSLEGQQRYFEITNSLGTRMLDDLPESRQAIGEIYEVDPAWLKDNRQSFVDSWDAMIKRHQ